MLAVHSDLYVLMAFGHNEHQYAVQDDSSPREINTNISSKCNCCCTLEGTAAFTADQF